MVASVSKYLARDHGSFQQLNHTIMIEVIANLLTPAMLAMAPPSMPNIEQSYDWQTQRSEVTVNGEELDSIAAGTLRGTNSLNPQGAGLIIDDWNQD